MGGTSMWGDRSGSEPIRARSALRLRLVIALAGGLLCAAALVVLVVLGWVEWPAVILLAGALIGAVDAVVVTRRLRTARQARS